MDKNKFVCEKDRCAGCMACVEICPKNAVKVADTVSEYNALIDSEKCIDCGACHKVCQVNNTPSLRKPILWKEGWAKDEKIRKASSSGGFASAIERAFINNGGVVCSCAAKDGGFGFSFAYKEDEVDKFVGSKYVKSNPAGIYKKINRLLKENKKVLFLGLPCQAAAVRNYTKDNERLYTADLICHGSPSPKILESFLNDYKNSLKSSDKLSFRTKANYHLEIDGERFTVPTVIDTYTRAFLEGSSYTENCYSCQYAKLERVSDITLGDSWGSKLSADEQKKGISIALCQTEKGIELLENAELELFDVDLQNAVEHNHQLSRPSVKHPKRESFLSEIKKGTDFKKTIRKVFPKRVFKQSVYTALYKIGIKK